MESQEESSARHHRQERRVVLLLLLRVETTVWCMAGKWYVYYSFTFINQQTIIKITSKAQGLLVNILL